MNEEMIIRHGASGERIAPGTVRYEEQTVRGPSLAMVYAPRQRFARLYDPGEALLRRGTLFRELYKPFVPGGRTL